jgi:hypothetical protein
MVIMTRMSSLKIPNQQFLFWDVGDRYGFEAELNQSAAGRAVQPERNWASPLAQRRIALSSPTRIKAANFLQFSLTYASFSV